MEIIILGCWAPYPKGGGACSGYLLRAGGLNILLEAGNGSLSRLREFVDFRLLDGVIITHLHHDHYLDLFPLRHAVEGARREGKRSGPVRLVAPSFPDQAYQELACYKAAYEVTSIESLTWETLDSGLQAQRLDWGGMAFRFVRARHSVPAYSIAVEGPGKFVFSGDTARTEELVKLAAGADLFLCEASGLDSDAEYLRDSHLTARQAGEIAGQAGVKRLVLTHFWPEYEPAELCRQATGGFGKPALAAVERVIYKV
ncbi:ribonuclease Z [Pelotomaculum schinkii]|uniref:Ribonuclease Z n=1 Tax=Pelotomaculum schinkii TaxID=78350 RepID=A0A4Y7REK0_9FIRM|nr:MBL fold metallo-hydrolase [Pelotomaculum schinkii]TEB07414.1 ribonuclease Z [Pelotomaculum schinkii]